MGLTIIVMVWSMKRLCIFYEGGAGGWGSGDKNCGNGGEGGYAV